MSQLNINNANPNVAANQVNNVNNANNNAPGVQQNPHLPPELQNARPSDSIWAKIGRVALGVVRVIGAVATLGISEIIIRKAIAARDAPEPRVPHNPDPLPNAQPQADVGNTALTNNNNVRNFNLPQGHIDALNAVLTDLAGRYGNNVPKNLDDLRKLKLHSNEPFDKPFVVELEKLINKSDEYVDPARLQRLAKELLEPEMARRAVGEMLQHKAKELGMELQPTGVTLATKLLMQTCAEKMESLPVGHVKNKLDTFLNPDPKGNAASVRNAFNNITKHVDVSDVLRRAQLQDGVETKSLPPAYKTAFDKAVNELRTAYGQDCLPTDKEQMLKTRLSDGHSLYDTLRKMANKAQTAISVEDFTQNVKNLLKPVAQHHALSQALGDKIEKEYGLKLHPQILPTLTNSLLRTCLNMKNTMLKVENTQGAQQALETQKAAVGAFCKAVADNVKHMEETYLPQVQPQLRPILQNFIRSLPFDNLNKKDSDGQLKNLVFNMRNWQASIPLGDPSLNDFCTKLTEDINIRMQRLAGQDTRQFSQNSNIAMTFQADVPRNVYTFNGKTFDHKPAGDGLAEFTQMVPTAIDQQFLSKLANQYLWTDLRDPLQAQIPPQGDPDKAQYCWRNGGDVVQGEARNNGLTFSTTRPEKNPMGNFSQAKDVGLPEDGYFSITVAEDKKTAVVEMVLHMAITTEGPAVVIPTGTVTHTMQLTCELSGGDPNVKPRVTEIKLGQEVKSLA